MWIILLDRSGSMGEPFAGGEFAGRTKQSDAASKLEAAKQAVREHLAGLGTASRIALVAFDSAADVVYDGNSNDGAGIRAALDGITARGSTDIAGALIRAAQVVHEASNERTYRALVVTDGKSDLAAAQVAADALARTGAVIDVLLIDPTSTGEAVARAIAVNGIVSAVASSAQLQDQVATAKAAQEEQQEAAKAFVARHDAERVQLAQTKPVEERLAFTATYPGDIVADTWYPFVVYLHLAALQAQVERQILEQVQAGSPLPFVSVARAAQGVTRGTSLTLTPRAEGIEFNPPSATIQWYEDIQDCRFRFRAASNQAGTSAFGQLDVAVASLPIAHLGIAINVRADVSEIPKSALKPVHAGVYQDVFASYSSQDAAIVQACRAVYWGLGVQLTVDKQTLRAGQEWDPALREIIDKCDLFQLFWSNHATKSEPVRQEYLHALKQVPGKQPGYIRPVTWEEPHPRIPEELKPYHFTPLDLSALARLTNLNLAAVLPRTEPRPQRSKRTPVPVAALPLLPGAAPQTLEAVREDLSEAVQYLEELTGLRYYPVPTLLVDEHVVKTVRTTQTVDLGSVDPEFVKRVQGLQAVLSALCLQFHVRGFQSQDERREGFDERFGAGRVMSAEQFEWVRTTCESFPRFTDVVAPQWRTAMRALSGLAGAPLDLGLRDFIQLLLELVIEQVSKDTSRELYADEYLPAYQSADVPADLMAVFNASGGRESNTRSLHRLAGPPRAFVALLSASRDQIVAALPAIEALDPARVEPLPDGADELLALCTVASFIAREVLPDKHPLVEGTESLPLRRWIEERLHPGWTFISASMVEQGIARAESVASLTGTLHAFLDLVGRALDQGLAAGDFPFVSSFWIPKDAWEVARADIGEHGLTLGKREDRRGQPEGPLEGPFSGFVALFHAARARVLNLLSNAPRQRSARQRVFVEMSPTFGIFAPARSEASDRALHRWAAEQGVAQSMTLPGSDRVLLCLGAGERFEEKLRSASDKLHEVRHLAAQFQRCVLVHEHFHAILELGLDASGGPARGPKSPDTWNAALRLNEALAVWAELHFVRGDATMEQLVWDYIRAGEYPDWPYAGASRIESLYASAGIDAVRQLMGHLRDAPELAQRDFDR